MNKIYKIKYTKYLMRGGAPPPCGPENEVLNDCANYDNETGKVMDAIDHDEFVTVFDDPYKLPEGHCFKKETICKWKNAREQNGQTITNPLTNNEIPLEYLNDCLNNCD